MVLIGPMIWLGLILGLFLISLVVDSGRRSRPDREAEIGSTGRKEVEKEACPGIDREEERGAESRERLVRGGDPDHGVRSDPPEEVVPVEASALRFQLLGACSKRRCYRPDIVHAGTVLSVKMMEDAIWTMRSGDRFVGMFPPRICRAWMETPEEARWRHVVVVHDVNLNDKYGQCIVQPYEKMCADLSVSAG